MSSYFYNVRFCKFFQETSSYFHNLLNNTGRVDSLQRFIEKTAVTLECSEKFGETVEGRKELFYDRWSINFGDNCSLTIIFFQSYFFSIKDEQISNCGWKIKFFFYDDVLVTEFLMKSSALFSQFSFLKEIGNVNLV